MAYEKTFPQSVIEILRRTKWNPDATMSFEGMSGAFRWSDEFPGEALDACIAVENWAFRYVYAYRASLIMGQPREEIREAWDQLVAECPDWPGFRLERRSADLKSKLEAKIAEFDAGMEALDAKFRAREHPA